MLSLSLTHYQLSIINYPLSIIHYQLSINNIWLLAIGGFISGLLAGILGIGGGTVLVPILVALNAQPVQATATSNLAIVLTSVSGTLQNWRMGYLDRQRVLLLGLPSLVTAQIGAYLGSILPGYLLLSAFSIFLILNIFLVQFRKKLIRDRDTPVTPTFNPTLARLGTGGTAGLLAGLFGIGGGVIMVPLQMLLLGEKIKVAIQTSLGVIVMTSISAVIGHAWRGNVLWFPGLVLGIGGLLGAQISTRFLPKLRDRVVNFSFCALLALLSVYSLWRAWQAYFQ
ncbi:sulfite exporter TauE/SafE family protein [Oscillatoria sp. FACHB-1406]|uniref:sulfite exporter TauE/SafE family protein n=1 Tax=Oscillatoria sp. FACHB-1406 TaxID=2692846 RepID=UPI001687AE26|nr:sulfite exporter TauE/SafE family protein [Oscillatoria sp. FACHB-1406]MBD2576705.1 sulfite exporter TauE/SafE family protein [Oscillatoria sp. FACHB-1406]